MRTFRLNDLEHNVQVVPKKDKTTGSERIRETSLAKTAWVKRSITEVSERGTSGACAVRAA